MFTMKIAIDVHDVPCQPRIDWGLPEMSKLLLESVPLVNFIH